MHKSVPNKLLVDIELLKAICENRCILFVGAGLTRRANYRKSHTVGSRIYANPPNWDELLTWLLESPELKAHPNYGPDWVNEVNDLISQKKLLVAAQEIQERLGKKTLRTKIGYIFNSRNLVISDVHKIIPYINFRAIITTNYDNLLEKGYRQQQKVIPKVLKRGKLMKDGFLVRPTDPPFIFYMHGRYDEDLVLGTRDFQEVMHNTPGYRQFLETLFSVYTVLFAGFSGDDPHLESLLDRLASISGRQLGTHYLLAESGRFTQIAQRRWEDDRRVRIINYDNTNRTHAEVTRFFEALLQFQDLSCGMLKFPIFKEPKPGHLKIFISYSRRIQEKARHIQLSLIEDGHEAFLDLDLRTGENWNLFLSKAHSETELFIIVWDRNAVESSGIQYEANYALYWSHERELSCLIVQVDQTPLPMWLSSIETISISSNLNQEELYQLRQAVNRNARKLKSQEL